MSQEQKKRNASFHDRPPFFFPISSHIESFSGRGGFFLTFKRSFDIYYSIKKGFPTMMTIDVNGRFWWCWRKRGRGLPGDG
jgi:hypothetical protein